MSTVLKGYPYYKLTLPPISEEALCFENTTLKHKVIDRSVETIKFNNTVVKADIVGNSVIIEGGRVNNINATHNIDLTNCSAGNIFNEEGSINAFNCNQLYTVCNRGSGEITLVNCPNVKSVTSQGSLKLNCSNVEYSVHAQGKAILYHSRMQKVDYTPVYGINPSFINCTIKTLTIKPIKKQVDNNNSFVVPTTDKELPSINLNNCTIGTLIFEGKIKKAVIFGTSTVERIVGGEVVKCSDDEQI